MIEQRIEHTEERLNASPALAGLQQLPGRASTSIQSDSWHQDRIQDTVVPSVQTLRSSQIIQQQVDERLQHLEQLNEKGMFKSRGEGADTVWVKQQVPWPQNFILVKVQLIMTVSVFTNGFLAFVKS